MKKLLIPLLFTVLSQTALSDLTPVIAHKAKLSSLAKRIESLKQDINNSQDKHETLIEELSKAESQIGLLNVSLQQVSRKLQKLPTNIHELQKRISTNERTIQKQQTIFAKQIRQAYIAGQQDFLKLLLQEETPERISRLTKYYRILSKARKNLISDIEAKTTTLKEDKKQINTKIARLEKLKTQKTNQKKTLAHSKKYREEIIRQIRTELKTRQAQLKQLENDKTKLTEVITNLERSHRWDPHPRKPFAKMRGKLPIPVKGYVTRHYGENILNSKLTYNGIFIQAKSGSPVKAIYPGNVIFADWLRGFGLMLIIDHGGGYMSLYAHNESLYKHAGETVEAKELIAKAGHTGGQSKPGLYFEIRQNGLALNPTSWLNSLV